MSEESQSPPDPQPPDSEPEQTVTVEVVGLALRTHHGVSEAEREVGQRLELDATLEVASPDALLTDRIEDTADYGEVCAVLVEVATERSYRTLERLASVACERLAERFGAESVTVRAAKTEPPIDLSLREVAVEVSWEAAEEDDDYGEDDDEAGR